VGVAAAPAGLAARDAALDLLAAVLDTRTPLDEALAAHEELARLEPRDRGFARMLAATALRRLGQIDALVAHCLARPLPPKGRPARHVLRLGVAQLLFLGTPAHAAVDSSVRLAVHRGLHAHKALINAVLRRLAAEGPALAAAQDADRLNTPAWLWQGWAAAYGEQAARAIAAAHRAEPPLDLAVRDGDAEAWAGRLGGRVLPGGALRLEAGGPVDALPGYAEGAWWVQDAAAALPARLLGDVAGATVLDLCAAPGGKSAQLAAAGARVIAVDRAADRLALLAENARRLGLAHRIEAVAADVETYAPPAPATHVLLDAPCTGTGTIRRHPDIPHLKRAADVPRLAALQARLLAAAAARLAPGGTLVYSVCSLEPAEGPDVVAAVPGLVRAPLRAEELPGLAEAITPLGDLRTHPGLWPEAGGMDGFYAARLRRPT